MLKKSLSLLLGLLLILSLFAGCAKSEPAPTATEAVTTVPATEAAETEAPTEEATEAPAEPEVEETTLTLPDGVYTAVFDTDSGMFHVNEANEGKGVLTVKDGEMTIHVTLAGKGILNLFLGTAEEAQAEGAELLQPSEDEVTFSDGLTETAHGFDIPVPALDEEFDCALIGSKGKWYDHKVSVSEARRIAPAIENEKSVDVTLTGGSGRASVESPAVLVEDENGAFWAVIVWSSKNYEYMLVDGVQYDPIQAEGENSTFLIPVVLDEDMAVSGLTVAMSEPHLVDYTLHFDSVSVK